MNKQRDLVTLAAYLENKPYVADLLKFCNFFPKNSWREWEDGLGNEIKVTKKRSVKINFTDKVSFISDLYYKADFAKLLELSSICLLSKNGNNNYYWLFDGSRIRFRVNKNIENNLFIFGTAPFEVFFENLSIEDIKYVDIPGAEESYFIPKTLFYTLSS